MKYKLFYGETFKTAEKWGTFKCRFDAENEMKEKLGDAIKKAHHLRHFMHPYEPNVEVFIFGGHSTPVYLQEIKS